MSFPIEANREEKSERKKTREYQQRSLELREGMEGYTVKVIGLFRRNEKNERKYKGTVSR